jgi:hypothetical protein
MHALSVVALLATASPLSSRVPVMLLAGVVLAGVVVIGTRRWWQAWLAARQLPQEPLRSESLRNRD